MVCWGGVSTDMPALTGFGGWIGNRVSWAMRKRRGHVERGKRSTLPAAVQDGFVSSARLNSSNSDPRLDFSSSKSTFQQIFPDGVNGVNGRVDARGKRTMMGQYAHCLCKIRDARSATRDAKCGVRNPGTSVFGCGLAVEHHGSRESGVAAAALPPQSKTLSRGVDCPQFGRWAGVCPLPPAWLRRAAFKPPIIRPA